MSYDTVKAKQQIGRAKNGDRNALSAVLRQIDSALDTLSDTELGFVDGVTAGTAAASKAIVLDATKNATGINALSMTTITALNAVMTTQIAATLTATNLNGVNGAVQTNTVTNARLGVNPTQGTVAFFGTTPVSQLPTLTTITTIAPTNSTPYGYTLTQAAALLDSVAQIKARLQALGFIA